MKAWNNYLYTSYKTHKFIIMIWLNIWVYSNDVSLLDIMIIIIIIIITTTTTTNCVRKGLESVHYFSRAGLNIK